MPHRRANWRIKMRHAAWAATALALPLAMAGTPIVHAQAVFHGVNINVGPRVGVISHVDPGIASHAPTPVIRTPQPTLTGRLAVQPHMPTLHTSPNLYPACGAASRGNDGECVNLLSKSDGSSSNSSVRKSKGGGPSRDTAQ